MHHPSRPPKEWPVSWPFETSSPRTTKAREYSSPDTVRLTCGFNHQYGGTVRKIQENGYDMDGDEFWHDPINDFDPKTCVVCGHRTIKVVNG